MALAVLGINAAKSARWDKSQVVCCKFQINIFYLSSHNDIVLSSIVSAGWCFKTSGIFLVFFPDEFSSETDPGDALLDFIPKNVPKDDNMLGFDSSVTLWRRGSAR